MYWLLKKPSSLWARIPCNIDKLFRRIKQFEVPARQGGGVCGIELALWDLAGKAYGVPVYQMLGGKFRDRIRMYCDTDIEGKHTGKEMGEALKKRMDKGFTFLKMDLGIDLSVRYSGRFVQRTIGDDRDLNQSSRTYEAISRNPTPKKRSLRNRMYDMQNIPHPFTGVQVTEYGYDILEQYVKDVRNVIGYEIPLAIDHFGHIGVESCIRLARRD
ncbi:MAG: hypothetical protein ACLR0U_29440 [Enterocloster clostridioformis]